MAPPAEVRADETEPARHDGKSLGAYRTTGEVAAALDLPPHVLRFWEAKFPQLKPLKRGGGRRYYRPEDVALLRRIRQCLYQQGYTIRGVQQLLRDGTLRGDAPLPAAVDDMSGTQPAEFAVASVIAAEEPASAPLPACEPLRATLEELRRELVEIRALLDRLTAP
ncbi:MAG TPA: MerR family transcriptional regulator [Stellaceae bacterium]|nr:MerR family transcriptional regulator [Stellaceae bacterium]